MSVLRFIRRVVFGLFAVVGGFVVLAFVAALVITRFFPGVEHPVPDRAVLTLDLADGISEQGAPGPLAWAFGRQLTILDLVQSLDAAGRDERVKGLVARIGAGQVGMAQAQEIRDAVRAFRERGKFAVAFAETFGEVGNGNINYYLATAFDEIWLQPSGDVNLIGISLESPYVRNLLNEIGVVPRIDQREEYKGAMDFLTSASMPQPVRQNFQRLVDSLAQQIADGIAAGRKTDAAAARALIDGGPYIGAEALAQKLVDRLGYWDEVDKAVTDRAGAESERISIADYSASLSPGGDASKFALVYGLGPVQLTADNANPVFGEATMDSQTVSEAIRDAAEDESVRAIIFRVDSPGGSYVASDTIWRAVDQARAGGKPVIVSMGEMAASGGYFVAAPASQIVAQPGTITGSIGVLSGKVVLSDMWSKLDVVWDGVRAGANADMDSPNRDYSAAGWTKLQAGLDRAYADFMGKVANGRQMSADAVRAVAKGQVWTGADAKANGLVNELGGYATAIGLARKAAGLADDAEVSLTQFPLPDDGIGGLLRSMGGAAAEAKVDAQEATALLRLVDILAPIARALAPVMDEPSAVKLRAPLLRMDQ